MNSSDFDLYTEHLISRGASGVRIIVSKGSKSTWHGYVVILGWMKGKPEDGVEALETARFDTYLEALAALEELISTKCEDWRLK
jgi:hypothetical protein